MAAENKQPRVVELKVPEDMSREMKVPNFALCIFEQRFPSLAKSLTACSTVLSSLSDVCRMVSAPLGNAIFRASYTIDLVKANMRRRYWYIDEKAPIITNQGAVDVRSPENAYTPLLVRHVHIQPMWCSTPMLEGDQMGEDPDNTVMKFVCQELFHYVTNYLLNAPTPDEKVVAKLMRSYGCVNFPVEAHDVFINTYECITDYVEHFRQLRYRELNFRESGYQLIQESISTITELATLFSSTKNTH